MPPVQRPQPLPDLGGFAGGKFRVLKALATCRGSLTRPKLQRLLGHSSTYIAKIVGMSDPVRRAEFEQTRDGGGEPGKPNPCLLTLGLVHEYDISVPEDGINETAVEITPKGREVYEALKDTDLARQE